jgi:ProP effector
MSHTINPKRVIEILAERFPRAFAVYEKRRVPLKLGIRADLLPLLVDSRVITERELKVALNYYTRSWGYLRASVEGAWRIDLNGKAAGAVTAAEATSARIRLEQRDATMSARKAVQQAEQAQQERSSLPAARPERSQEKQPNKEAAKPRRLTLADLKAAWVERRRKLAAAE